ncbi:hypothetical protein [Flavobacterium sp.]|uniref:hypothetical protein n=1 Tax=Flavobacterium sp. TaxID=239 RepID=UPI002616316B|nr:hypothetical protein [Flavobacterium sp.]MDD2987148.1 hypothetical protein [Flavobacterium sp.]
MKTLNRILLMALILLAYGCEDILEEDITDDFITLVSPSNKEQIISNVVNFQWQTLKGAKEYRIQVFSENQAIILDSLVGANRFTFQMVPGAFQWRVRGENFAYTSSYSFTSSFSVIESDNLTNQQVILLSPNVNYYNATSIIFNWQSINVADTYNFELVNVTNGQVVVHQAEGLTTNSISLNSTVLSDDAEYTWKVKALNSLPSATQFASRNFYIDRINPNQPVNTFPSNNSSQNTAQTITFTWSIPTDTGVIQSAIAYVIEFSNDANFSSVFQTSNAPTNSFQQIFQSSGDYYWRIKAIDKAGNTSNYSNPFKFTID